jgi:hypothetical protein
MNNTITNGQQLFNEFMEHIGYWELGEQIWKAVCEDCDYKTDFKTEGITPEQYDSSDFMIKWCLENEFVDADRFGYFLDTELEAYADDNDIDLSEYNIDEDETQLFLEKYFDIELLKSNINKILGK